jgi:hypothetical protein
VIIHPERISVVDDPILGARRKVVKFTVFDDDTGPTEHPRAQLQGPPILREGEEFWAGWSTLLPRSFPEELPCGIGAWLTFASTYGAPYDGMGPTAIRKRGCTAKLTWQLDADHDFRIPWEAPVPRGRWIDFVVHQKQSEDSDVGFVELYVNTGSGWRKQRFSNGRTRFHTETLTEANDEGPNSHNLGLYRMQGMYDVLTLYHAAHKVGTSFDVVAPRSYG